MKRLPLTKSPFELLSALIELYDEIYLLESLEGSKKLARYSFIGFDPHLKLQFCDDEVHFEDEDGETTIKRIADPMTVLREVLKGYFTPYSGLRFVGGAVGYVAYDAVRYWETIPDLTRRDTMFPTIELAVYSDGIVFDHWNNVNYYYYSSDDRFDTVKALFTGSSPMSPLSYSPPRVNIPKEVFEEQVRKAKSYIAAGDILQVVLSKRYDFTVKGDLLAFYKALRRINPSPYMYFLKLGSRKIIGSSPEMLVRVEGDVVETYPIAGTRPVTNDAARNDALAAELLSDPKERAEHTMLVDLARNDLGKVSTFGSVQVPEFMEVQQYSHVQHIVSRVTGRLSGGHDSFDALRAVFPAGTVSGAPKVRAMEIIEECEPTSRGPYAGAVGYFSNNGNADFAITIRTLIVDGQRASIQVGAGIVADSVPEREWFETEDKIRALLRALEFSEAHIE